jgi:hypothetical protein
MKRYVLAVAVALVFVLCTEGCMSSKPANQAPPTVYVTPCNVAGKGIQIRVNGDALSAELIKPELEMVFVDNFKSPAAEDMRKTYTLNCYYGGNVDERRDYYYCAGKYMAPELDENQVIKRWIWKDFKIGFSFEVHDVGSWVDSNGKIHNEGSVYYLTTRTVDASCYVA